jgi:glutamate-ammonia-ligase adenylyltransferase
MKALIAAEVARKDLADDIKRGPGGIREIEFLVQALQLIRAGREPALQRSRPAGLAAALVEAGQIDAATGGSWRGQLPLPAPRWRTACRCCAMSRCTHACPDDASLARAAGESAWAFRDWPALQSALDAVRAQRLGGIRRPAHAAAETAQARCPAGVLEAVARRRRRCGVLADAGFERCVEALDAQLRDFLRGAAARQTSDIGRARLDRVMPALIAASAAASQPDAALRRVLTLVQNVLRRSSYLALLDEQPQALARLVDAVVAQRAAGRASGDVPVAAGRVARQSRRRRDSRCSGHAGEPAARPRSTQADGDIDEALAPAQRNPTGDQLPHRAGDCWMQRQSAV